MNRYISTTFSSLSSQSYNYILFAQCNSSKTIGILSRGFFARNLWEINKIVFIRCSFFLFVVINLKSLIDSHKTRHFLTANRELHFSGQIIKKIILCNLIIKKYPYPVSIFFFYYNVTPRYETFHYFHITLSGLLKN